MYYLDHPILYSDKFASSSWARTVKKLNSKSKYWQKYAKKRIRREANGALKGIRPRV